MEDQIFRKRKQKFLYPRQASSLYHTSKIMDTDLLWFYVRLYGLRVTDLMQGPVYGIKSSEHINDEKLYPEFIMIKFLICKKQRNNEDRKNDPKNPFKFFYI